MTAEFRLNGIGSLKVVTPTEWRGLVFNYEDDSMNTSLTNDDYSADFRQSHSFDVQVKYDGVWVTPLHVHTKPTFKTTRGSNSPGSDNFNSFSGYGFACATYGFDGIDRGSNEQNASWTSGQSKFSLDRDNNITGNGIIHWKFNGTALNLGSVVIFT